VAGFLLWRTEVIGMYCYSIRRTTINYTYPKYRIVSNEYLKSAALEQCRRFVAKKNSNFFGVCVYLGLRVKCSALSGRQLNFRPSPGPKCFFVVIYGVLWCQHGGDVSLPST